MNLERFLRDRRGDWDELRSLLSQAKGRPERLGAAGVRRLGSLYRRAAADLALARRRFPLDPVVGELEDLVGRARTLVYDAEARRESVANFFATRYWRLVRERPAALLVATTLLIGTGVLSIIWAASDPESAAGLVPAEYRAVTEPRPEGGGGLPPGVGAAFSSEIFVNNVRVSFLAFAGGVLVGLLTAVVLAYNGVLLGAIGGLAVSAGNGPTMLELVAPHGVLELSCIVVAGAAGLRLGWAIVDPGHEPRRRALVAEARRTVEIVLGTIPWFVLAGLVEGLVTPRALGTGPALLLGCLLAAAYWALVVWRGAPVRHDASTGGLGPSS